MLTNPPNEAFTRHAGLFTAVFSAGRHPEQQAAALADLLAHRDHRHSLVIEAGCGAGRLCAEIRRHRTGPVLGIDRSAEMLALARSAFGARSGLTWVQADLMAPPIVRQADAVLLLYSLLQTFHQRELQERCLRAATSMLRRGGLLMIECRNESRIATHAPGERIRSHIGRWEVTSWSEPAPNGYRLRFALRGANGERVELTHELARIARPQVVELVEGAGLTIVAWRNGPAFHEPFEELSSRSFLLIAKAENA